VSSVDRPILRNVVAILITASAAAANAALWPELGSRYPMIVFFPAIAASSWFGGFWAGALSTMLATGTATYMWFAPAFFGRPSHRGDAAILALFFAIGLTIATLFETLKRRAERAERAERQAIRLADELRISDARQLDSERVARQRAEDLTRLKDELLATISHELRTPLGAILGWADVLKQNPMDIDRRDRALQAIHRNAQRQAELLGQLLDAARIKAGTLQLTRDHVDLASVVREAWEVLEPAADAKGIEAVISVDAESLPISYSGDAARLLQVMINLFSNAVKFTPAGGRVHVQVHQTAGAVEIIVSDTGQGIPHVFLPFVFEPFRQADGVPTDVHTGLGLGLAIAKHLVEAHGGDLRATSDGDNRGASFIVRLPLSVSAVLPA
jgi:signal transduction histidine kinase